MIRDDLAKTHKTIAKDPVLKIAYAPSQCAKVGRHEFSEVACVILDEHCPGRVCMPLSAEDPVVIALRMLDFLSSRQGYIRRKGQTFRTEKFYREKLPYFVSAIKQGKPLRLSTLCLCTTLANTRFCGESPYPHMASYIALENVHKIAQGAKNIYPPGILFYLGFEGGLFQPLYFHSDTVVKHAFALMEEINREAHRVVAGEHAPNPVKVVDAMWMIDQTFGNYDTFAAYVEKQKPHVSETIVVAWQAWYKQTVSGFYFPSVAAKNRFLDEQARWRNAVSFLKRHGGKYDRGLLCFAEDVIPFTPSGRHSDMLAIQMVPENSYLPHQRIITHEAAKNRWRMKAYEDIRKDALVYAPHYVEKYSYPFYFELVQ